MPKWEKRPNLFYFIGIIGIIALTLIAEILVFPIEFTAQAFARYSLLGIIFLFVTLIYFWHAIEGRLIDIKNVLLRGFKLETREIGPKNPGREVYPGCKWIMFDETQHCQFQVYCSLRLMTEEGCPHQCHRYEAYSPTPSGKGALTGMISGASVGLIGGPPGVIFGGIAGGIIGNKMERESLEEISPLQSGLNGCAEENIQAELYIK